MANGFGGSYQATYNPARTLSTRTNISTPGMFTAGQQAAGLLMDPSTLLETVFRYKQRAADMDLARQMRAAAQAAALSRREGRGLRTEQRGPAAPSPASLYYSRPSAVGSLDAAKQYLDLLEGPDWYGTRTVRAQNPAFRNLMAAGAMTGIQFPSGFQVYADLARGINPLAGAAAQKLGAETGIIQGLPSRRYATGPGVVFGGG